MSSVPKKKRKKLTRKAMLGIIFVLVFIVIFVCMGVTYQYIRNYDDSRTGIAYALTYTISEYIDDEKVVEYIKTEKPDAYYNEVQNYLTIIKSEGDLEHMYVFVPLEDEMVYIWDTEITDGSALGRQKAYPEDFKENAMSAYKRNPEYTFFASEADGYELLITVLSPVYDKNGDPIAIVAADIEGISMVKKILDFNLSTMLIVLLSSIIPLIIFYRKTKKNVIVPIKQLNSAAKEMVEDLESERLATLDIHTGDEIEELSDSFEQMSVELRDYIRQLSLATAEKERFGTELNMAKDIQTGQLPNTFPAFPDRNDFDICASMTPAKVVGGDFYDFFLVDDDHLAMVIADVSGKGIPASLFMMISKILIKNRLKAGDSPSAALERVNNQLLETNNVKPKQFVTVWLAVLELSTGKGIAANAGHEHPVIKRADGAYELAEYRHSPPVSLVKGLRFREHEFEINSGDRLFVYTDGVAEAMNSDNELFGTERLLEVLNSSPDASPEKVLDNVTNAISEFVGEAEQFDDITMISFAYFGSESNDTEN